jgi:hypothetical protein
MSVPPSITGCPWQAYLRPPIDFLPFATSRRRAPVAVVFDAR